MKYVNIWLTVHDEWEYIATLDVFRVFEDGTHEDLLN